MRQRVHQLMNQPATDLAVALLIVVSVILLLIEIVLGDDHPLFDLVETAGHVFTGIFALELALRFYGLPSRRRFLHLYWLNILAVAPVLRPFRFVRLLRLLRLLRLGAIFSRRASGVSGGLKAARLELFTLFSLVLMAVLSGAIGLHLAEKRFDDNFGRIDQAIWYSIYSLIAGEPLPNVPHSPAGRAVALFIMLSGLAFFATFTGIVSAAMINRLRSRLEEKEMTLEEISGHIVVCGWNRLGYHLLGQLRADARFKTSCVVLITEAPAPPEPLPFSAERFFYVSGDFTRVEVLRQAGIERATAALLLADKTVPRSDQDRDARTVLAALTIEKIKRGIFTCVELLSRENQSHLELAGVEEIIVPDEYAGKIMATATRNRGMVCLLDELLTRERGNNFYKAGLPPEWAGKAIGWVHQQMKERFNAILLGIERPGAPGCRTQVVTNPAPEESLRPQDRLLFIASGYPAELPPAGDG